MSKEFYVFSKWVTRVAYVLLAVWLFVSVPMIGILVPHMNKMRDPRITLGSYTFNDSHGQYIEGFRVYENSSGSWVTVGGYHPYDEALEFEWDIGVAMKLVCYTWLNSTFVGAGSSAQGKLLQQHNVTVTRNSDDVVVFTQQNFTYESVDTGIDPPLWFYEYSVVLNFLPTGGEIYYASVTWETYQEVEGSGDPFDKCLARWDFGNDTGWTDDTIYCTPGVAAGDIYCDDSETGHNYGYTIYTIGLEQISKIVVYAYAPLSGAQSVVRVRCVNGTWRDFGFWTSTSMKTVTFTEAQWFNLTKIGLGWTNKDSQGNTICSFSYLIVYIQGYKGWFPTSVVVLSSYTELDTGMLLAGVSLIGLCLIPIGTAVGALMVKKKQFNEDNWLLPMMIVLLGFAVFIGALAMLG